MGVSSGALGPLPWALLVGALATLGSYLGVARYTRWARGRIVDVPNARSSHTRVTPRGGGVVIVVLLVSLWLGLAWRQASVPWGLIAGGIVIAVISFVDDVRPLPSLLRLGAHIAAAGAAAVSFGPFPGVEIPFVGVWEVPIWLSWAATLVWVVALTNIYNFMDGIDGIAGGQGLVAAGGYLLLFADSGSPAGLVTAAVLAGGCAGFLFHNWSPARIFMGDVGSAFIGYTLAALPLLAVREAPGDAYRVPFVAVLMVWPFVADGVLTLIRRAAKGENVLAAHRSHLYQRLQKSGWSHARVSRLYIAWAVLSILLAHVYRRGEVAGQSACLVVAGVTLAAMLAFTTRRETQLTPVPKDARVTV